MTMVKDASYEQAIDLYLEENDWLDDSQQPLVTQLYKIAQVLDSNARITAGMTTEFRMTFMSLHNMRPDNEELAKDSDEAFFASLGL